MTAPADRLRRVREHCETGVPLDPDDRAWLAGTLSAFERGDDFELAAGLRRPGDKRSWREKERCRERARLLLTLAEHYPLPGVRAKAREMDQDLRRYRAGNWRRGQPPTDGHGAALHNVVEAYDGKPPQFESIRQIMGLSGY